MDSHRTYGRKNSCELRNVGKSSVVEIYWNYKVALVEHDDSCMIRFLWYTRLAARRVVTCSLQPWLGAHVLQTHFPCLSNVLHYVSLIYALDKDTPYVKAANAL
jgi:hypothetical protein